jgi:glyoxylase-like metal-dependent hydrolase (beta-lactamase superfamily II)
VRVRQSRAFWMNSLLLLDPRHAVIVDPGVLPSELDDLAAVTATAHPERVTLLFSHGHWDHVLGRPWWPGAASLAHARFAAELSAGAAGIRREAESLAARHGESWARAFEPFEPDLAVEGEREIEAGPWSLVVRDAPGHAPSQVSAHLPAARLLFAADMLSDIEIPMLDGPCASYRRTLESLGPLFESGAVETLVPGHGSVARGAAACTARLVRDTLYLALLEAGVREARARGRTLEETQSALEGMDYAGKDAAYSMRDVHRANVRFTWEGLG